MPVWNPPPAPAGGAGGSNVTVDIDGYITVPGGGLPFKTTTEDLGNGVTRFTYLVKDVTLGEVAIAFTDVPSI